MDKILIVSGSEKSAKSLEALISRVAPPSSYTILTSGSKARRILLDEYYDYLIVNFPLLDDNAVELSRMIASTLDTGVLLFVKEEFFDQTLFFYFHTMLLSHKPREEKWQRKKMMQSLSTPSRSATSR